MVRTEQDAINAFKEIAASLDARANPEYTLTYSLEWWKELRKLNQFSNMTDVDLNRAELNEDGYIGTYGGVKCYLGKAW